MFCAGLQLKLKKMSICTLTKADIPCVIVSVGSPSSRFIFSDVISNSVISLSAMYQK